MTPPDSIEVAEHLPETAADTCLGAHPLLQEMAEQLLRCFPPALLRAV